MFYVKLEVKLLLVTYCATPIIATHNFLVVLDQLVLLIAVRTRLIFVFL